MPASVGEQQIQHAILDIMKDRRVWSNAELKQKLARALPWTSEDLAASKKRPNERLWENRVNNALSPSRSSSLYAKGHVESGGSRGAHKITGVGYRFITDSWTVDDLLRELGHR
jgi:Mrr N-terminal domain